MRRKWLIRILSALISSYGLLCSIHAQRPNCSYDFLCQLNEEAKANDAAGIRRYSEDLIRLIVPEQAGQNYIDSLTNRLANAEQKARDGQGNLVPEANIARSFNNLMKSIKADSAWKADDASVRKFRARSASVQSLSALFTAGRNGTDCNPGESVLILYLLVFNDGKLSEHIFDSYTPLPPGSRSVPSGDNSLTIVIPSQHAAGAVSEYCTKHLHAIPKLFDAVARNLEF